MAAIIVFRSGRSTNNQSRWSLMPPPPPAAKETVSIQICTCSSSLTDCYATGLQLRLAEIRNTVVYGWSELGKLETGHMLCQRPIKPARG